jgi:hypothetical protein
VINPTTGTIFSKSFTIVDNTTPKDIKLTITGT